MFTLIYNQTANSSKLVFLFWNPYKQVAVRVQSVQKYTARLKDVILIPASAYTRCACRRDRVF